MVKNLGKVQHMHRCNELSWEMGSTCGVVLKVSQIFFKVCA
jgi:hypothetical protein